MRKGYIIKSAFWGVGLLNKLVYRLFQLRFYLTMLLAPKREPVTEESFKFVKLSYIFPWNYKILIAGPSDCPKYVTFKELPKALA